MERSCDKYRHNRWCWRWKVQLYKFHTKVSDLNFKLHETRILFYAYKAQDSREHMQKNNPTFMIFLNLLSRVWPSCKTGLKQVFLIILTREARASSCYFSCEKRYRPNTTFLKMAVQPPPWPLFARYV
jgi:hypothetical protein